MWVVDVFVSNCVGDSMVVQGRGLRWVQKKFLAWKRRFSVCVSRVVSSSGCCFWRCWLVFSGALQHSLWCVFMLVVVRIRYVAEGFCVSGGSYVWHRGYGAGCYGV